MHARPAVARGDSRGSGLTEFVVRKLPDRVVELVGSFDVADMTGVRYRVNFTQTPVEPGPSNAAGGRSGLAARSECPHTHRQLALAPDDRSGPAGAVRAIAMRETELSFRHTDVPAACFARREQQSPGAIASLPSIDDWLKSQVAPGITRSASDRTGQVQRPGDEFVVERIPLRARSTRRPPADVGGWSHGPPDPGAAPRGLSHAPAGARPRGGVGDERRSASRAAPPSAQATNRSGPRANSPAHASEQKK